MSASAGSHPFVTKPHRTLLALSVPVFFSLIAEPLTGLIDTAFVARLGVVPLAALGVGAAALSSVFWMFGFLGVGTQTEVARAAGRSAMPQAVRMASLALALGVACGVVLLGVGWVAAPWIVQLLGADPASAEGRAIAASAVVYMRIRLVAAPALLLTLAGFGALRGLQDMRTPLWIALLVNAINIALDPLLIFGLGPIPAYGIAGAAWASVMAQWVGALLVVGSIGRKLGLSRHFDVQDVSSLIVIGGNLFVRTGLLTLFLLLTTRLATQIGADSGAAHAAIRQVWLFTALGLDALAVTAQSLVGYFEGAGSMKQMKRVAALASVWGLLLGGGLGLGMVLATPLVALLLVPAGALAAFGGAWVAAAVVQPLNAVAFVTDGIHWGTGDFAFLRNAMLLATGVGAALLFQIDQAGPTALFWVWCVTGVWIAVRALFGVVRVWPGIGRSPFSGSKPAAAA